MYLKFYPWEPEQSIKGPSSGVSTVYWKFILRSLNILFKGDPQEPQQSIEDPLSGTSTVYL